MQTLSFVLVFQGYSQNGKITTLGRGGSDLSARRYWLWQLMPTKWKYYSDVNGIYTADPRIVPDAKKLDYISYSEMLRTLSKKWCAKVLNHRCVQLAAKRVILSFMRQKFF